MRIHAEPSFRLASFDGGQIGQGLPFVASEDRHASGLGRSAARTVRSTSRKPSSNGGRWLIWNSLNAPLTHPAPPTGPRQTCPRGSGSRSAQYSAGADSMETHDSRNCRWNAHAQAVAPSLDFQNRFAHVCDFPICEKRASHSARTHPAAVALTSWNPGITTLAQRNRQCPCARPESRLIPA